MTNYLINLSGNICEILIILYFFKGRYKPRVKPVIFVPCCVLFVVLQFINNNLFLGKSLAIMFFSIVLIFIVTILYDTKWLYRVALTVLIFLIIIISEIITAMCITSFVGIGLSEHYETPALFLMCTLLSKFVAWFIVLITKKQTYRFSERALNKYLCLALSLPIASVMIYILLLKVCYQMNDEFFTNTTLITSLILLFANISIFEIISKQNSIIETEQKLMFTELYIETQKIHYEALYKHQSEMKSFRHDTKNTLVSLIGMLKAGQTDKVLHQMENSLDFLSDSGIIDSHNPVVDALLQAKIQNSEKEGITLKPFLRFEEPILVDEIELGIVLGNALDNAIEATAKISDSNRKNVICRIITKDSTLSIVVTNPIDEDIDTTNLSTTKADREMHGYGVKSMRNVATRYNGTAEFICKNKIFTTTITMENR